MPSCSVKWCINKSKREKKADGITFHLFPPARNYRSLWIEAIRLERRDRDWFPTNYSCICSLHFKKEDFYVTPKGNVLLKDNAIPNCTMAFSNYDVPVSRRGGRSKPCDDDKLLNKNGMQNAITLEVKEVITLPVGSVDENNQQLVILPNINEVGQNVPTKNDTGQTSSGAKGAVGESQLPFVFGSSPCPMYNVYYVSNMQPETVTSQSTTLQTIPAQPLPEQPLTSNPLLTQPLVSHNLYSQPLISDPIPPPPLLYQTRPTKKPPARPPTTKTSQTQIKTVENPTALPPSKDLEMLGKTLELVKQLEKRLMRVNKIAKSRLLTIKKLRQTRLRFEKRNNALSELIETLREDKNLDEIIRNHLPHTKASTEDSPGHFKVWWAGAGFVGRPPDHKSHKRISKHRIMSQVIQRFCD